MKRYAKRRRLLSTGRQETITKWITSKSTEEEKEKRESTKEARREEKEILKEVRMRSKTTKPQGEFKDILEMFRRQEKKIRKKSETKPIIELQTKIPEKKIDLPIPVQTQAKPRTRLEAKINRESQSKTPGTPARSKNFKKSKSAKKPISRGETESPLKQKNEKMRKFADIRTFFESKNSACNSKSKPRGPQFQQKVTPNLPITQKPLLLVNTAETYTSNAGRPPSHWRLLGGSSRTISEENIGIASSDSHTSN